MALQPFIPNSYYIQPCPISSSVMDWLVFCQNIESLTPIAIAFGDGFKERFQENGGGGSDPLWLVSLSGETPKMHTGKKGWMRTWREGLQARRRSLTRNQTCCPLDLDLLGSGTVRKDVSVVSASQSMVFCDSSLSRSMHHVSNTLEPDSCGMGKQSLPAGSQGLLPGTGQKNMTRCSGDKQAFWTAVQTILNLVLV